MKAEGVPARGRSLLELVASVPMSGGAHIWRMEYEVHPRAVSPAGELYGALHVPGGHSIGCRDTTHSFLDPRITGCLDEDALLEAVRLADPRPCRSYVGQWRDVPVSWVGRVPYPDYAAWDDRGMLDAEFKAAQPDNRKILTYQCASGPPSPPYPAWYTVGRASYFWCPSHFRKNGPPNAYWPNVCTNSQKGTIRARILQADACPVGNPCIPSSGAKIQTDEDFSWGRLRFDRTYNSLRQLAGTSGLGDAWNHGLSMRVWTATQSGVLHAYVLGSSNELEDFRLVSADRFASVNIPGKMLYRDLGSTNARWLMRKSGGEAWQFDAGGKLVAILYPESPADSLTLVHCTDALFTAGTCAVRDSLAAVVDGRGRTLTFEYRIAQYSPGSTPEYTPARLVGIRDESGLLVSYEYDALDRLSRAVFAAGDPMESSRTYHYGESTHVCRDGAGNPTPSCPVTGFPHHLTGIDINAIRFLDVTYDHRGRATSSSHANGADRIALSYPSASVTQVAMPDGALRTYQYGSQMFRRLGDYSVAADGSSHTIVRTYGANDRLFSVTDARDAITEYGYDAFRETSRIQAKNTPSQRTHESSWDDAFNRVSERRVRDAGGALTERINTAYNPRGQQTARCDIDPTDAAAMSYTCSDKTAPPAGAKVRRTVNTWCETGDISAGTCPLEGLLIATNGARPTGDAGMAGLDDITTYSYRMEDDPTCATAGACTYRKGDLWKVSNALGQVSETVTYDKAGRPTRVRDTNGTVTDFIYHPRGWLVDRIVRALGSGTPSQADATTHIDYDAVGNVTQVTQADGSFLVYTYDAAHRLIKVTDNLDNALDYCPGGVGSADCLDAAGNRRIEQVKDPLGTIKRSLRRTYNQLGQVTALLNAQSQATLSYPAATGYDANGNATHSLDGLGVETRMEYDPLNRLKKTIQDYLGPDLATRDTTTEYAYDARDNLREVTDPDGLTTTYDYDGLNNLTGLHSPDTNTTSYSHDPAGNRITQTDARGITSTYTYDALNRVTGIAYPTSALDVTFHYDQPNTTTGCGNSFPTGRLTGIVDASGSTTYCYDRRGNVTSKIQVTGVVTRTVDYTWTKADRLASITYPSGGLATYTRNAIGQVIGITWKATPAATSVSLIGNATYYPFGPLNVLTYGNGRTLTKSYDADYAIDAVASSDPGGLILDLTTDLMGNIIQARDTLGAPTPTRTYSYDRLYRLTGVVDSASATQEGFSYNKTGDRTSKTLPGQAPQVYSYLTGTHHLGDIAGTPRDYDENGNTLDRGDGIPLEYDDRNRLSALNGSPAAQYGYNGRGERVMKTVGFQNFGGTETLAVYDEQGKLLENLVYSIDSRGKRTLQQTIDLIYLDDQPIAQITNGAISYLETDHLGTPRLAADPATNAWQWEWNFFGSTFGDHEPIQSETDGIEVSLRYPGQQYDAETGLHYNYFRDYEPGTGRYVESDPIGLKGGISTFSYVLQNPMSGSDPLGLQVYYCRRPLGRRVGSQGIYAFNHQFLCVINENGMPECGGFSTDEMNWFSPSDGRPSRPDEDQFHPGSCGQVNDASNECMAECLLKAIRGPRPQKYYVLGQAFGAPNCQTWVHENYDGCREICRNRK